MNHVKTSAGVLSYLSAATSLYYFILPSKEERIYNNWKPDKTGFSAVSRRANESRRFGLKSGLNFANVSSRKDVDKDNIGTNIGFAFGGYLIYILNKTVSIQPEIMFSQKGYVYREDTYYDSNYLEIPILTKISIPIKSSLNPKFLIGPTFSIKLSSSYEISGDSKHFWNINSTDLGVVVGLGGIMGNIPLSFDVRYSIGFKSICDYLDAKNRVFSLMFGYLF